MAKADKPSDERIIQSGVISTPKPIEFVPQLDGKLIFFYEWCKKCGICVAICPQKALVLDSKKAPYLPDDSKCVYCSQCWRICPDFAIIKNPNWKGNTNGAE